MRKGMMLSAGALALTLLAGCGGGGDSTGKVERVLVGYVYVTKNDGTYGGAYTAYILPANNLKVYDPTPANGESGDEVPLDKPTGGVVQLSVDGSITRAIDTESFNLATSNEIICTAKGAESGLVTVSVASPIVNGAVTKTLSVPTINLGTSAYDKTVLGVQSPNTPTYTPGLPDEVRVRLNTTKGVGGVAATGAVMAPADMMASNGTSLGAGFVSGQTYQSSVAVFDKNGIVVTGATTTLASSDATRVSVSGTQLVAAVGQTTGDVQVTVGVTGTALVSEIFHGSYNQGSATAVTVTPAGPTDLLWAAAGVEATVGLTSTVKNEVGTVIVGATVAFTSDKSTANDWNTGAFNSVTSVFTAASGTTNGSGQLATTVTAPTSTGALAAGNAAKGTAIVTATSGSATGTATLNITRPLGSLTIAGPNRLDVGAVSSLVVTDPLNYRVTSAQDIDGDVVTTPSITWSIANTAGAGTVGNIGDTSGQSTSVASINASTAQVTAGGIAGQAVITATSGAVTATKTTEIYGVPTKIVVAPGTVASVIAGATGEYAGAANTTQPFSFTLIDAYGHTISYGEISNHTTTSSISSAAAGSITAGGLNIHNFTLTFGTADGTATVGTGTFTWTGIAGGSATALGGITRTIGVNGS